MNTPGFHDCEFELFDASNQSRRLGSLSIHDNLLSIVLNEEVIIPDLPVRFGARVDGAWGKLCYEPSQTFTSSLDLLSVELRSSGLPEDTILVDRRSGKGKSAFGNVQLRKRRLAVSPLPPKAYNVLSIETALY